jgi:hypothetical protein
MSNGAPTDPVQALLAQSSLHTTLFTATSRYYGMGTTTMVSSAGEKVVYLQRRFVPPPERFQTVQVYTVAQGDRLDNIAAQFLGDPTLFWRLCDANRAMRPDGLTETAGRTLRITLPEGIPGAQGA